jgi:hypothetical protein
MKLYNEQVHPKYVENIAGKEKKLVHNMMPLCNTLKANFITLRMI